MENINQRKGELNGVSLSGRPSAENKDKNSESKTTVELFDESMLRHTVLSEQAYGLKNREIAQKLGVSIRTVQRYAKKREKK